MLYKNLKEALESCDRTDRNIEEMQERVGKPGSISTQERVDKVREMVLHSREIYKKYYNHCSFTVITITPPIV